MANSTKKFNLIHSKDVSSFDLSITMRPEELHRLIDSKRSSFFNSFGNTIDEELESSIIHNKLPPSKDKTEMLFFQFLEIFTSPDSDVFETITDVIQTVSSILEEYLKNSNRINGKTTLGDDFWLEQEYKTWKLLHALYKDRIMLQSENHMEYDVPPLGCSEKEVISSLYTSNSTIREYQLIVDWLEDCCVRNEYVQIGHTTDQTIGWENTLFQLKSPQESVLFSKNTAIVKEMDPDAPIREKRPLHDLDEDDNLRLAKCVYTKIRQGKIDEAMAICKYCGHTWRAVILEGWRLHYDSNFDSSNIHEKMPMEGNSRRDVWKKFAWKVANSKKYDEYARAVIGAFCGHLGSLKSIQNNTWDDLLWAYLKVQIDIRVESEIRSCCIKPSPYQQMPEDYWNGKMSMEQIFDEISVHNDSSVREAAKSPFNIIQKFLILDNVPELLQQMRSWVQSEKTMGTSGKQKFSLHMLRFLTHIVLFLRQINKVDREELADSIVAAYVESLIAFSSTTTFNNADSQLIAFYTAYLPGKLQILLYSKYLETIHGDSDARQTALAEALNAGLDIENITRHTVQTIRNRMQPAVASDDNKQIYNAVGDSSGAGYDKIKISSLEWLTFYPEHRGELLWQANAMIRVFLAESKIDCVREVFEMVPDDSLTQIISIYGSKDNLPYREECTVKEYLSYKIYMAAIECFENWSQIYHNRPKEPEIIKNTTSNNFTERIASEHKEQNYRMELKRWKNNLTEQAFVTRDALYNVLLFPEKGWLIDPDTTKDPSSDIEQIEWENRAIQMDKLRSICIPEIVLFLHKVLHLSGDYSGCVKLADDIASEDRQLYKVYTKHKLAELMSKLTDSSLALLNEKLDPWGFPITS